MKIPKSGAHLSLADRREIQRCLDCGNTFKAIAKRIGKAQTTVSREVKRHLIVVQSNVAKSTNEPCKLLLRPPFVCNPCGRKRSQCVFSKSLYYADKAHEAYLELLSEARTGIPLNHEEFYEVDRIITEGVKKGQHIYHIAKTHNLPVSISTIYRHQQKGYLSILAIDLPRKVKFKKRKSKARDYIPKGLKNGRSYLDFLEFTAQNQLSSWVEMDTVIGVIGGKAIVTFDFTFCNFMFGLLIDDKTSAEVSAKITNLKQRLTKVGSSFGSLLPLLLTDNGGEFADVFAIENDSDGIRESRLFFCDPQQSSQKPHVEKNHTLFRDIVPKGTSFDNFTQETVNLIFSHVNAVKRKIFAGKCPYDIFAFTFGEDIAKTLGIDFISPEEVIQSPKLLKHIKK